MFIIILGEGTRVTMEDGGKILSNIRKWGIMAKLPEYDMVFCINERNFMPNIT